jgi:hypothetical protein
MRTKSLNVYFRILFPSRFRSYLIINYYYSISIVINAAWYRAEQFLPACVQLKGKSEYKWEEGYWSKKREHTIFNWTVFFPHGNDLDFCEDEISLITNNVRFINDSTYHVCTICCDIFWNKYIVLITVIRNRNRKEALRSRIIGG